MMCEYDPGLDDAGRRVSTEGEDCDICGKPMVWRSHAGWMCRDCD